MRTSIPRFFHNMSAFIRKPRNYDDDKNFSTSLHMGIPSNSSKLYDGPEDDYLIDRHGGTPLYIGGKYIDKKGRYAIIDRVSSILYYSDGTNLNLLNQPFIIDTTDFTPVRPVDINYSNALPEIVQCTDKKLFNEITKRDGIEHYLTFLFQQQTHINRVSKMHA